MDEQEKQNNGNKSIKPSRFKAISEETPQFNEQSGKFTSDLRKSPLIPDKNKPNLYR